MLVKNTALTQMTKVATRSEKCLIRRQVLTGSMFTLSKSLAEQQVLRFNIATDSHVILLAIEKAPRGWDRYVDNETQTVCSSCKPPLHTANLWLAGWLDFKGTALRSDIEKDRR